MFTSHSCIIVTRVVYSNGRCIPSGCGGTVDAQGVLESEDGTLESEYVDRFGDCWTGLRNEAE